MLLKCWFLSCRLLLTSGQRPPVITPGTANRHSLSSLDQMAVICRTGIVCAEHLQHAGSADGLPGFHPAIFTPGTANRHPLSSLNQIVTLFTVSVSNGFFLNRDSAVQNYIQNSENKILYKKQPLFLIYFCKICRFLREHIYKLRQKGDNLRKIGICLDNLFTLVCITALCLTRERASASAAGKRKADTAGSHVGGVCCLCHVICWLSTLCRRVTFFLAKGGPAACEVSPPVMRKVTGCRAFFYG